MIPLLSVSRSIQIIFNIKIYKISVEEILARTQQEEVQKIYNLPQFTSTLEFLTMFALSSGRLLKVCTLMFFPSTAVLIALSGRNA